MCDCVKWVLLFLFSISGLKGSSSDGDKCPLLFNVARRFTNQGFHRDLQYSFELITNGKLGNCQLCVSQMLPNSMYVNADQINEMMRLKKLNVLLKDKVDIEAVAEESDPILIHIFATLNETSDSTAILSALTTVPVHFRYNKARSGGGTVPVVINPPERIGLLCEVVPTECSSSSHLVMPCPDSTTAHQCNYLPLNFSVMDEPLRADVPVGDTDQLLVVQICTFLVTFVASSYALMQIISRTPRK